jgi:hypothetical protein
MIMAELSFPALQYPAIWPPPELPPYKPNGWSRFQVLGLPFRYLTWLRHVRQHERDVLDPIADEIVSQLERRPVQGPWPRHEEERKIAQIISDAVGLEKGLPHSPALHPDDPFPLLFWGPFDDVTPLIVRMDSRDKLKREIPGHLIIDAWNDRWTIQRFIQEVFDTSSTPSHSAG